MVAVNRNALLQEIRPDMILTKNFFLRIYGYAITEPAFANLALKRLEDAGCSHAHDYYIKFASEYERKQIPGRKEAAAWYVGELQKKWNREEGEERRIQERTLQILQNR